MTSIPLSKDIIDWIIPCPTLGDLSSNSSDIDNDIGYLLNWMQPYFPPSLTSNTIPVTSTSTSTITKPNNDIIEPSQRVKAAIRSCLKDDSNQIEFIRLYNNSITIQFNQFFNELNNSTMNFLDYFQIIKIIHSYYIFYLQYLNISPLCKDIFTRNLNSLFYENLINNNQSQFLNSLMNYLDNSLYNLNSNSNSNSSTTNSNRIISVNEIMHTLSSINLINEANHIMIKLSIQKIKWFITNHCSKVWNRYLLEVINQYIQNKIYPNFLIGLKYSSEGNIDLNIYLYDLIKIAHDELVSLRIKEIYDIILNYPHSSQALYELYQCFSIKFNHNNYNQQINFEDSNNSSTNLINDVSNLSSFSYLVNFSLKSQSYQRTKLVDNFIKLSHEKILHSGANTIDVIITYINTIKSFLIIDPKGVLLDKVARPIRTYLKTREDIIIKIVEGLLEEDDKSELIELSQELRKIDNLEKQQQINIDDGLDLNWLPDPIDALPDFKKAKVTDIIESLISIFDSNEIFISQFTKLFGEKLIKIHNYDVKNIEQHLNLLKLKFGNNEFTSLDIMIKDIKESKLINEIIKSNINNVSENFHTSILSHLYWPTIIENISEDGDLFKVPNNIEEIFTQFSKQFSNYKSGRSLKFLPSLGSVKLQLEFNNNKIKSFNVSPDKASIISLFNDQHEELSAEYISETLGMTPYMVSDGLSFWVKEGVLLQVTKSLYIVNDDNDDNNNNNNYGDNEEAEVSIEGLEIGSVTSDIEPKSSLTIPPLNILWPNIQTLLENITMLSSEKILTLLKLRVPIELYDVRSLIINDFEEYLDWLVEQGKLELSGGFYKLKN
ncbi:uncharacterized protein RJT21DRAFT_137974 [Scheffersomyces amazonensis]|uniref:uncharacterized protein n=1 Tax=Scheffersomyces amazonensis TaxID=1078765 RepID=UPI00315C5994